MYIPATACLRTQGACGSKNLLCGVAPKTALSTSAAGTVAGGKSEGSKGAVGTGLRKRGVEAKVRRFEEIPHTGRNGWVNLMKFWRENRFQQLHKHMEKTFKALGPIYRYLLDDVMSLISFKNEIKERKCSFLSHGWFLSYNNELKCCSSCLSTVCVRVWVCVCVKGACGHPEQREYHAAV